MDLGNRFRLIVNAVDVVAPDAPLPKLPTARAVWVPRPSLKVAAAAWIHAGGAHHTAFSQALTPEHLEDYAEMAGIELVLIDESTSRAPAQEGAALERGLLPPGQGPLGTIEPSRSLRPMKRALASRSPFAALVLVGVSASAAEKDALGTWDIVAVDARRADAFGDDRHQGRGQAQGRDRARRA